MGKGDMPDIYVCMGPRATDLKVSAYLGIS